MSEMKNIAEDTYVLDSRPSHAFNSYLTEGILFDAGTRYAKNRILRQLKGQHVTAHVVTHVHSDHQGASHAVCEALGIPLWCNAIEADGMESGDVAPYSTSTLITRWQHRHWAGPGHPVERRLAEGDKVGSFSVIENHGHSPGQLGFWREADGFLIAADVLFNRHPITGITGLHEPPEIFTANVPENREAIRRIAALHPKIVGFGHGPPLFNDGQLEAFAEALPE